MKEMERIYSRSRFRLF